MLGALVDTNGALLGLNLGCANVAEHKIVCNVAPVRDITQYHQSCKAILTRKLDEILV